MGGGGGVEGTAILSTEKFRKWLQLNTFKKFCDRRH